MMKNKRNATIWAVVMVAAVFLLRGGLTNFLACAQDNSIAEEKAAIRSVIENSIGWAANKDTTLFYSGIWQSENYFSVTPSTTGIVNGYKALQHKVRTIYLSDAFKATGHEIYNVKINMTDDGQGAWFSARLNDYYEWNGNPGAWENARWTGVLRKKESSWVIVQQHFSFASN